MRSRPATRTALFLADILFALPRAGRGQRIVGRVPKNAPATRRAEQTCEEATSSHSLCNTTVASGRSRRLWRTLGGGRNARATITHLFFASAARRSELHSRTRTRFWRTLPTIHPRESPGSAGSAVMPGKAYRTSRSSVSTVLESKARRNNKSAPVCEQPVNEWNFLWKAMEKLGETSMCAVESDPRYKTAGLLNDS
jgi:hypothetical protein